MARFVVVSTHRREKDELRNPPAATPSRVTLCVSTKNAVLAKCEMMCDPPPLKCGDSSSALNLQIRYASRILLNVGENSHEIYHPTGDTLKKFETTVLNVLIELTVN